MEYPILFVNAFYVDIKRNDKVHNLACQVVYGIGQDSRLELLAIQPVLSESTASYTGLFDQLRQRGIANHALVVSDTHKGIWEALFHLVEL